jgi:hypothetical protein
MGAVAEEAPQLGLTRPLLDVFQLEPSAAELEQLRADYRQGCDQLRADTAARLEALRTTYRTQLEALTSPTATNLTRLHRPRVYVPARPFVAAATNNHPIRPRWNLAPGD